MAKNEVNFGTDAWSAWAKGVQDRLDALETAKPGKSKAEALDNGDVSVRLAALERQAGIHPVPEVVDPTDDGDAA